MHYLKQILHQARQTLIREVIVDHHLADNVYEICTRHGNDIFLVADENTAKLVNKNVLNKISHLIIPAPLIIPARDAGIYDRSQCCATWMTPDKPDSVASLETVNLVRNKAKDSDLVVAFGAGTVNDICKYASSSRKKITYRSQQQPL